MMEKWDYKKIKPELERLLSLWERGELTPEEEDELKYLIDNIKGVDSFISTLGIDTQESLEVYLSLQDLKLSDEESAMLDSFVSSLALEEAKSNTSWRKWSKVSWDRIYLIVSAACVLLLIGIFMFIDISFDDKREGAVSAIQQDARTRDSVYKPVSVKDMIALDSRNHVNAKPENEHSSDSEAASAEISYNNSANVTPATSARSKKRGKNSAELEWEVCKRLLKEMNLHSESISSESTIIVNENFNVELSSKIIVTDMLKDIASRVVL